jgi:hypothetical protein
MKRSTILAVIIALIFGFVGFSSPNMARAVGCTSGSVVATFSGTSYSASASFPIDAGDTISASSTDPSTSMSIGVLPSTLVAIGIGSVSGTMPVSGTGGIFAGGSNPFTLNYQYGRCSGAPAVFKDGRLNSMDAGQSAAIYCTDKGLVVYTFTMTVHGNFWKPTFTASFAEIARVKTNPEKNLLIKQAGSVRLYRLASGELQINAPGLNGFYDYSFIFTTCQKP